MRTHLMYHMENYKDQDTNFLESWFLNILVIILNNH